MRVVWGPWRGVTIVEIPTFKTVTYQARRESSKWKGRKRPGFEQAVADALAEGKR